MRNLYEILGVEPSAGPEEIKHAYRRLSMKMHPDRGGEHEDFAEMKAAYEVLIDSDRRAKYDATGSTEVETPLREKAEKMVVALANEAIHEVAQLVFAPFETTDLVARIRSKMHEAIRGGEKQKVDLHAHQAKLEGIIKRFKRSSGENLIAALLAQQIEEVKRHIEGNAKHQLLLEEVLVVLETYSYEVDEAEPRRGGAVSEEEEKELLATLNRVFGQY